MDVCLFGDCRESMRNMIAEGVRVNTCVTSPPYWGLRDYGTEGQLGLESTPEEYVANMVEVFRLVRDLLADDGTLWLNLGDSYAAGKTGRDDADTIRAIDANSGRRANAMSYGDNDRGSNRQRPVPSGLKPKDLVGIPWRVAFALQADGWYLRSDIIWAKPNPMPESVTDRPTKAHEYLFLLSKRERYYYDSDAIAEESSRAGCLPGGGGAYVWDGAAGRNKDGLHDLADRPVASTRNRRTVWTVATESYSEAHFATFPTALIEPCILAGTRVGGIVFDPFLGSGTTAQVAQNLGRHWLGCELNAAYASMQQRRAVQRGLALSC